MNKNTNDKSPARSTARKPRKADRQSRKADTGWTPQTKIALAAVITPGILEALKIVADVVLTLTGHS